MVRARRLGAARERAAAGDAAEGKDFITGEPTIQGNWMTAVEQGENAALGKLLKVHIKHVTVDGQAAFLIDLNRILLVVYRRDVFHMPNVVAAPNDSTISSCFIFI